MVLRRLEASRAARGETAGFARSGAVNARGVRGELCGGRQSASVNFVTGADNPTCDVAGASSSDYVLPPNPAWAPFTRTRTVLLPDRLFEEHDRTSASIRVCWEGDER